MIKKSSRYFPAIDQNPYPNKEQDDQANAQIVEDQVDQAKTQSIENQVDQANVQLIEDQIDPTNAQIVTAFKELNNLYLNLDNYIECELENGFLTFKRASDTPFVSSDQQSISNSGNDQLFLTHYYCENIPSPSGSQIKFLIDQATLYFKSKNDSLSPIYGFSFSNINNHFFPIALTERPSKGPLISFFKGQKEKVKITPEEKFSMIIQIIQGMAFIHENKFIHSNLNPTTVYLNDRLEPIICDYIFVPQFETTLIRDSNEDPNEKKSQYLIDYHYEYSIDAEKASQIYKSDIYVAPEILKGGTFDQSADIYSLGVIMLFILSEQEPIKKGDTFEFPSDFPKEWKDVIEKCTRMNPSERMNLKNLSDLLDKKRALRMISSLNPQKEMNDISEKTDRLLLSIQKNIKEGFDAIEINIFREMIPNMNDIDNNTKSIISAAEKGHIKSVERVADYFHTGKHNFYADDVYSFQCYEYAASKNSLFSLLKVAEYYEKGIGTNIDLTLSIKNYQQSLKLIENEDPKRTEIEIKINEISSKMRTLKLKNVPLNLSEGSIRSKYKNIESVDIQKDEKSQNIIIKFVNFQDLKAALKQIKQMKKNVRYKFEIYYSKKVKTNRFDSLEKSLPRLDLGDFHILENNSDPISSGKFANVYIVNKDGDQNLYVAKVFHGSLDTNYSVNSFKREIILSSEFKDFPSIVQYVGFNEYSLTDYIDDNGKVEEIKPTLFMKYVPCGNLEKAISEKPKEWWNDTMKLKMIIGIAAGLSEIHDHFIIHRDIKPLNILLDENSEPVICDFGSARQYSLITKLFTSFTTNVGTYIYMAPELYKEIFDHTYSCEVDSYSFAIVIYQILTLTPWHRIYRTDNSSQIMTRKMENYISSLEDIKSDLFQNIIKTCWNYAADIRFTPQEIYKKIVDNVYSDKPDLLPNADINEVKKYITRLENAKSKNKKSE